jgi:hypothetical protein
MARLLWDPGLDAWSIAEQWLNGVYGREAGGPILEYLRMLHDHVRENQVHMPTFGRGQEVQEQTFTPQILARGKELWDRAEAGAAPAAREKVFAARAPEMCSRLFHAGMTHRVTGSSLAPHPEPDVALRDRFVEAAILGGAAHLREDDAAPEAFGRNYGRSYEVAVLENAHLRAVVVPELGGRLYSLRHVASGAELLHVVDLTRHVNYMPYSAGYAFSLDPDARGRGTGEAFRLVEQDGARAVVEALLPGKMALRSEYSLEGERLAVRHRVENRGPETAAVAPVTHPQWDLAAFGPEAQVGLRREDGSWSTFALNPERRANRDLEFAAEHKPAGEWRMASAALPVTLLERFDMECVQSGRLVLSTRGGGLGLELYFKPFKLAPGESVSLGTTWQFSART